jgi:PAS domain S-box-containing protein
MKPSNSQLEKELKEKSIAEATLRLSEEKYRFLFERNPASMLIYERGTLRILAVNEAFCIHYGYSNDEVLSMFLPDLYPVEEKLPIAELAKKILGHSNVGEWHHIKKDGSVITIIANSNDLVYQGQRARIAVVTDIAERKKAELEIKRLNQALEERVAERTAQLVSINKELESYSYSISHDLRAPLRAILGFSQILSTRHKLSLNNEGRQYVDYIVEASIRMEQLINDLLDYSRLGRKSISIHTVQLHSILDSIIRDFKQKTEEINARILIGKNLPEIQGDESLLRQIFTNLIENAINYRRTDTMLEIKIDFTLEANKIIIAVADNGIGIPGEHWEKIFNIFQRLHNDEKHPGTGIGLATVKKSVNMLNGEIWVNSIVGKGSTFFIQLPVNKQN